MPAADAESDASTIAKAAPQGVPQGPQLSTSKRQVRGQCFSYRMPALHRAMAPREAAPPRAACADTYQPFSDRARLQLEQPLREPATLCSSCRAPTGQRSITGQLIRTRNSRIKPLTPFKVQTAAGLHASDNRSCKVARRSPEQLTLQTCKRTHALTSYLPL